MHAIVHLVARSDRSGPGKVNPPAAGCIEPGPLPNRNRGRHVLKVRLEQIVEQTPLVTQELRRRDANRRDIRIDTLTAPEEQAAPRL